MSRKPGYLMGSVLLLAAVTAWASPYSDTVSLFKNAGQSGSFFQNCYGYAVFPTIGKGGFVVGGAHGNGRVYARGKYVGDTSMTQVSVGFQAGAQGYMLKSMPRKRLVEMIRRVHAGAKSIPPEIAAHLAEHLGDEFLTRREVDVLQKMAGGNRNRDIAEQLFISEETVKGHVKHIMEKLRASDRTEAVAIGVRRGIIHL